LPAEFPCSPAWPSAALLLLADSPPTPKKNRRGWLDGPAGHGLQVRPTRNHGPFPSRGQGNRLTHLVLQQSGFPMAWTITPAMFADLADEPHFVAIKESFRKTSGEITDLKNRCGDRYLLFCGVDDLILESTLLGAAGWVAGLVNAFPEETVLLWDLATRGKYEDALRIYRWFTPLFAPGHASEARAIYQAHHDRNGPGVRKWSARRDCLWSVKSAKKSWRSFGRRSRHDQENSSDLVHGKHPSHSGDRLAHRRGTDPRGDRRRSRSRRRHLGRAARSDFIISSTPSALPLSMSHAARMSWSAHSSAHRATRACHGGCDFLQ